MAITVGIKLEMAAKAGDAMSNQPKYARAAPNPEGDRQAREAGRDLIEVEIKGMEFLGSFYRAALGGAAVGEQGIRADLSINLVRRKNLEVGSKIPVRFPASFIRIYPGD